MCLEKDKGVIRPKYGGDVQLTDKTLLSRAGDAYSIFDLEWVGHGRRGRFELYCTWYSWKHGRDEG